MNIGNILCKIGIHNLRFVIQKEQCLIKSMVDTITVHQCKRCKVYRYKFVSRFSGFVYAKETGYQMTPPWGLKADK